MLVKIDQSWGTLLKEEFEKPYFTGLVDFVKKEYQSKKIYPPGPNIFRAFDLCPFENLKVVILGQDPYHGPNQANGLCFSVHEGVRFPPSLENIYKEIESDLDIKMPRNGNLDGWARQGVLLLNATLTVRAGQAGSHQKKGWETFTDAVIKKISDSAEHLVFILWGRYAQQKSSLIDQSKHLILQSAHPSPLSAHAGFFGNRHFSKTNDYLKSVGKKEIAWDKL